MKSFDIRPLSIIFILCLGILVYSNTFYCPFHFDDTEYISDNPFIRDVHNLFNIWQICPCRFVTFFSIALNYHFNGLNVFGYHLFNLAVHLSTAILVWWLILLTLSSPALKEERISQHARLIALLVGLVFVSHPIQTEAVTFIWQRAASMAAFFYLLSLCLYIKSRRMEEGTAYYFGSLITVIITMFTKENTITLPLMIVLYEIYFLKKDKNINQKQIIPFLLTLLIIPLTMLFTKSSRFQEIQDVVHGPHGISSMEYLLTQFRVMFTYIRLAVLPLHQNLDYDYPVFKSIFEWPVLLSLVSLSAIIIAARRLFSKYRLVSFSILWFFVTLLPESSLLPLKDLIFEHRLYLPMVGYSLFLVSGVYYLWGYKSIKKMFVVLAVIVAFNSILTYQRNKIWQDDFIFWNDVVEKSPHKARPYYNRGNAYLKQGNLTEALADYNKAIELDPQYAGSYGNRGLIYDKEGDTPKAMSDYNKAIEINPHLPMPYHNRGLIYAKQGNFVQALADFNRSISIDPLMQEAYNDRGNVYYLQGAFALAIADYNKVLEIDPQNVIAQKNHARAYIKLKGNE